VIKNKYMKKIIFYLVAAVLLAPSLAFADGGMIRFDPYSDRWDFADETNQQAFINYEKGVEKMILSVGVGDLSEGKTMWIFPVPADPNKVAVDVVTKLPNLQGEEISKKAQSNLDDAKNWLQATQIYTLPFALTHSLGGSSSFDNGMSSSTSLGGGFKNATRPDVVVYEHLEKEGITSEIVTARTAQGFNEYFSKKGLKMESNSIPVLQKYIGKEYSFVVSWINASSSVSNDTPKDSPDPPYAVGYDNRGRTINQNQKGVFVSFPTDKIFFPLMPTSVYGSKVVPAEIRVMGHVTPDVFADIKSFTKTEYYRDESVQLDKELKAFYNGSSIDVKYTKIEINAPSKFFTDDLWVKNSAPFRTFYQSFVAQQILVDIFFLIILCSVLTGLLVGWLLFKEWRNREGLKKFSMIGLANCLTILGVIALILPSNTKKDAEDVSSLIGTIKEKRYFWKRRLALGLIIADLPFLLISIFAIPLSLSGLFNRIYAPNCQRYGCDSMMSEAWLVIISFIPIFVLFVVWFLGRIRKEDKELFAELKSKKYSAWTFQPKDKRKIAFIFLYSISFLIISWIVVKLLIFSVGGN
jgi:hypothetical protein